MKRYALPLLLGMLIFIFPLKAQSTHHEFKVLDSLVLGGEGGWDYLNVDTTSNLLYISRGSHLQIVDLTKWALVGDIPDTKGIHGAAIVTSLGKGYTSNGRDSSVTVFDTKTFKTLKVIHINAANPDFILFDPFSKRVFTFNGRSNDATAIDVTTDEPVGTVQLEGKPEAAVSDYKGKIFVNIENKNSIKEFDPVKLTVLKTWPIKPGESASGLAFDRKHNRLFAGCDNKMMAIVDATNGKVLATPAIGEGVDACAFDPKLELAFSSNGEGTLTVVKEESPSKFVVVQNVETRRGARTCTLDERTHRIYLLSAKYGPPAPSDTPGRRPRPTMIPGSVTLIVVGQ